MTQLMRTRLGPSALADTRKAAERLDFRAEVDLDEGLRRLVTWWRGQRTPETTR